MPVRIRQVAGSTTTFDGGGRVGELPSLESEVSTARDGEHSEGTDISPLGFTIDTASATFSVSPLCKELSDVKSRAAWRLFPPVHPRIPNA